MILKGKTGKCDQQIGINKWRKEKNIMKISKTHKQKDEGCKERDWIEGKRERHFRQIKRQEL